MADSFKINDMKNVYYINHTSFKDGDTYKAMQFALNLCKEDSNLKVLTFLVYSTSQYDSLLGELGFTRAQIKNHGFKTQNLEVKIHTLKTYDPDYLFVGNNPSEVLVTVGLTSEDLEKFEDYTDIAHVIIVPWQIKELGQFLSIHEAIDIDTFEKYKRPADVDVRVKNAINWLNATSYPNEGYGHPSDSNRLKQMSNALKVQNVPLDYSSVVYCAINCGLIPSAARKTAESFVKAQSRLFTVDKDTDYNHLTKMMNTKDFYV